MPVNSTHRQYEAYRHKWTRCRDVIEGADAVKAKGEVYLPSLSGQSSDEYSAYKKRATFYNASSRTLDALVGAIFRKSYQFVYPEVDRDKHVTVQNNSLTDFSKYTLNELLTTGRVGILVDMPPLNNITNRCYLVVYKAEDIINWKVELVGDKLMLTMVVIREEYTEEIDEFEDQIKEQYRVLVLRDGVYVQEIYRLDSTTKDYTLVEQIVPTMRGSRIHEIPFIFSNWQKVGAEVIKPPLIDLVDINLSHYNSSADLEHGRHFTALPTAWVAGFPADITLKIGSSVAWISEDPGAKAGFLEFTGQGLSSLEKALEQKEYQMAIIGTRLLDVPKKGVEAAETYKVRNMGEHNVLSSISLTLSDLFTRVFEFVAMWEGKSGDVVVSFNTDFTAVSMTPNEVTALVKAYQSGTISWETLFYNFQKGEIIEDGITAEEEKARIEGDMILMGSPPPVNNIPSEEESSEGVPLKNE